MKYRDLAQKLKSLGFRLIREGANHEIWSNGATSIPVPRHREIGEGLAAKILKQAQPPIKPT